MFKIRICALVSVGYARPGGVSFPMPPRSDIHKINRQRCYPEAESGHWSIIMRKLTEKDTPFLRRVLECWTSEFPFPLDQAQLISWSEQFPDAVVVKGITSTAGWFVRQKKYEKISPPSESAIYRYVTGCMGNIDRAIITAEKLLGSAK
jgi:hypothetical protein